LAPHGFDRAIRGMLALAPALAHLRWYRGRQIA
jgi:hypothetical protein